jgi:hypothetical protein
MGGVTPDISTTTKVRYALNGGGNRSGVDHSLGFRKVLYSAKQRTWKSWQMMALAEKNYTKHNASLEKRFEWTTQFVQAHVPEGGRILDLGVPNPMSKALVAQGYVVENAFSEDLDFGCDAVKQKGFDAFTSFEVFEHMVNPLPLLLSIEAPVLIASVPLALWFSSAYRGNLEEDPFDEHYHEFEPWQFELLLRKGGWTITHSEKHTSYPGIPNGIRPILRRFYPRYFLIRAERQSK